MFFTLFVYRFWYLKLKLIFEIKIDIRLLSNMRLIEYEFVYTRTHNTLIHKVRSATLIYD